MSCAKSVNITELMTSYNFEIEELPDNLKCVKCKLVLKDACQVPCGCRFCRVCIDDMITRGSEFCPGVSEQCRTSSLSLFSLDYIARNSVSRLTVKCVNSGCVYECQLANIEEHLRECLRRNVECPFRELGCKQNKLTAEEIDGHLQIENRRHSEILIGVVANINKENEIMKHRCEESWKEINSLKQRNEDINRENEIMKRELELKKEQINSIIDRVIHVENENKSITREKADLADRVRLLTVQIQREIDERHKNDELDYANRVIDYVDGEIAVMKMRVESDKVELAEKIKSVMDDIRLINESTKLIKGGMCSVKLLPQPIQAPVKVEKIDAKCDWLINVDLGVTQWAWPLKESDYFTGTVHPFTFRLVSLNGVLTARDSLLIYLRIYRDGSDGRQVTWPFQGRVVITVAERDKREAHKTVSLQSRVERPPSDNDLRYGVQFKFLHSALRAAGLNLSRGVLISCEIFSGAGR